MSTDPANAKSCIRCGGTELYWQRVPQFLSLLSKTFSTAWMNVHVCGSCGFMEWYVPQDQMESVKEKFIRK